MIHIGRPYLPMPFPIAHPKCIDPATALLYFCSRKELLSRRLRGVPAHKFDV